MKTIKFTLFAGALLAATGAAAAQPAVRGAAEITRDQAVERADRRFARLDADRDGRVTAAELRTLAETRNARLAERQQRRGARQGQMFDRLDVDRNGQVTREEIAQMQARRAERRAERGRAERPGAGRGQWIERLDTDRDGAISREEFAQRQAQRAQRLARRAERVQRRGGQFAERRAGRILGEDGVITRDEFRARALQRFARLDADRDGTVTMAERQQVRQQRMERRQNRN